MAIYTKYSDAALARLLRAKVTRTQEMIEEFHARGWSIEIGYIVDQGEVLISRLKREEL